MPYLSLTLFVLVLCWVGGRDARMSLLGRRWTPGRPSDPPLRLFVGDLLYGLRSLLYGLCALGAILSALWTGYRWLMTLQPADPWRWMHGPVP